jgi:S1/P1 Nuclease
VIGCFCLNVKADSEPTFDQLACLASVRQNTKTKRPPVARQEAIKGTPEDWATESLLAAREAYQDPQTGKRIKSGTKLGDAYQAKNLPVARKRLAQAGMRLAMVLNEALKSEQP